MKQLLLTTLMGLFSLAAPAQQKINLAKLQFNETAAKVLQDVAGARQGKTMYDLPNMLSYGIDNKGALLFDRYAPPHVELLAYNEKVAGFGFRIMSYTFQQEIKDYLEDHYALKLADSSRWGKQYTYADSQVTITFQTVADADFKQGRCGHLDIKTSTLTRAIAVQEEKYKKAHR